MAGMMKSRNLYLKVSLVLMLHMQAALLWASIPTTQAESPNQESPQLMIENLSVQNTRDAALTTAALEMSLTEFAEKSVAFEILRTGEALSFYEQPPRAEVRQRFYNFWDKGWGKTILQLHKDLGYPEDIVQLLEIESLKLSAKHWDDTKQRKHDLELPLRIINAFHEMDERTRFRILTHLRRDQLVHMLIDWRVAIYTSSFNKVIDCILEPFRPGPDLEGILANLDSRELAILIESSSSFNRVQELLSRISYRSQIKILRKFYERTLDKVSMKYAVSFVEVLVHHSLPEVRGILLGWMLKDGLEALQSAGRRGTPGDREHLIFMMIASIDHFLEEKNRASLYAQVYDEKIAEFESIKEELDLAFLEQTKRNETLLSEARERLRTSPESDGIPDYLLEERVRQYQAQLGEAVLEPKVFERPSFDQLSRDVEKIVDSRINHRRVLVRIHPAYESFLEYFWHSYPYYRLERFYQLPHTKLVNNNQQHIQRHFMYDDIDGKTTFHFFEKFMKNWDQFSLKEADDHVEYSVPITNSESNAKLTMLVHKPLSKDHSYKSVVNKIAAMGGPMHTFVFRGHSYKLHHCINYIEPETVLTFIGSCGGFDNVRKILSLSPGTHLVLSKGTGTLWINQYFLGELNRLISEGQGIHWPMFRLVLRENLSNHYKRWKRKDELLKIYDQFYLLPHENIGLGMLHSHEQIRLFNQSVEAQSRGLIAERSN